MRAFLAKPLQVGGDVSNVVGGQALGNGLHDAIGTRAASSRGIVVQLFHDVNRVLAAKRRELRGLVAESGGSMAGHAGRNAAGAVTGAIQLLAGLPVRGVRLEP